MNTRAALSWMLWREFLDQRQNRMVWPIYLLMPLIGAALPALLVAASAAILSEGMAKADPEMASLINLVRTFAKLQGIALDEAAALLMLRVSASYFLLMPVAIVSIAGAYAIVGEKQQRTLEPVLATPISTSQFLLGKLLSVVLPATVVSYVAAIIGAIASVLSFYLSHGLLIWPDAFYFIAAFVLGPEIGAVTALVCLRVSARMQDPQAANQMTALILIPALLLVFSLIGPFIVLNMAAMLISCVIGAIACVALFYWVKRGFNREEILCRWR